MMRQSNRGGFTLPELLVALVILAVGLLGMASVTAAVSRMVAGGAHQTIAATVAQSRFETLRSQSCATASAGTAVTRGMTEQWTVTQIQRGATLSVSVTMPTHRGARTQTFRTIIPC